MTTVSIIIPAYNEEPTILELLRRVAAQKMDGVDFEVLVVDDGSRDRTVTLLEENPGLYAKLIKRDINGGKGAAVRGGIVAATGDIVIIQDADLEYDPAEYPKLLQPILDGAADVVYGSRFIGGDSHRVLYFWHSVANRFLTLLSNMFTDLNLTDMEVCYKVVRRDVLRRITLREDGFGFDPEITAKLAHLKPTPRIFEVGIRYAGRTYEEGKKIGWRDGFVVIASILRYNLFR
jgi:glycosyltransferase involved in cell wall biosynthesis